MREEDDTFILHLLRTFSKNSIISSILICPSPYVGKTATMDESTLVETDMHLDNGTNQGSKHSQNQCNAFSASNDSIGKNGITNGNNATDYRIGATDTVTNSSADTNTVQTVIDMKIIAHEMWKLLNCKVNPKLTEAFAKLPTPVYNTITQTVIYNFQERPANMPYELGEYSSTALFYIKLLQKHKQTLTDKPLTIIGLKCAYCAKQKKHVPGSSSFLNINDLMGKPDILADALKQRLLHLRNNCVAARQIHGSEVVSLFDSNYSKNDIYLKRFTSIWLDELKQNYFPSLLSSTAAAALSASRQMTIPQELHDRAAQQLRPLVPINLSADTAAARMRESLQAQAMQPPHNTVNPAVIAAAHNIAAAHMASRQQQLELTFQQQQQSNYTMLQQHHHSGFSNHQQKNSNQYFTQPPLIQQHLLQQQARQQLLRQHQQSQAPRQYKPRQRLPQIFPRNKHVPFVDLQKIYENCWDDLTWSVCSPPYDSDDDDDDDFDSKDNKDNNGTQNCQINEKSFEKTLPPLPPSKSNLDYHIPIQPCHLAQCNGGVPFLKEEDASLPFKKVRGRSRQSSSFANIKLPDLNPHDVVMPSEGCPLDLAESFHNLIGNRSFLKLVSDNRNDYAISLSEAERLNTTKKIIQKINRRGGSFLKANVTKTKGTFKTFKTSSNERLEYIKYRLENGFSDILNPKLRPIYWSVSGVVLPITSNTSPETTTSETAIETKASSTKTTSADNSVKGDTVKISKVISKVLEVEYAPKIGLTGGFLDWNNNKFGSNPKIRYSNLKGKILVPNTRGPSADTSNKSSTQSSDVNGVSNVIKIDAKKADEFSVKKGTVFSADKVKNDGEVYQKSALPLNPTKDSMDGKRTVDAIHEEYRNMPNGKEAERLVDVENTGGRHKPSKNTQNCEIKNGSNFSEPQMKKRARFEKNKILAIDKADMKNSV